MKLTTLEYFIAVAEAGSISAAAQTLHVAQPGLTKCLQSFEKEIGVQLLYRSSAGVRVTEVGKKVLAEAKQIVALCHGWQELRSLNTLQQVDIYSNISLAGFLLPDIILRFREKYPEITVGYYSVSSPDQFISASVQKPTLILDICTQNSEIQTVLQTLGHQRQALATGAYGILASRQSALAQKRTVTYRDLIEHYLVLPNILKDLAADPMNSTPIDVFLPDLVKVITPKRIIEVGPVSSVIDLVCQRPETYAVSFTPAHYRYPAVQTGELVLIPLDEPRVEGELSLIYSKQACRNYPALQELTQDIVDAARRFVARHSTAESVSG